MMRQFITILLALIGSFNAAIAAEGSLNPDLPQIDSSATRDGKGIPYGRSDSGETYLKTELRAAVGSTYGHTEHDPVKIGPRNGGLPHILYLNSLRGPNGEPVEYERVGTCCDFESENAAFGAAMLDVYRVRPDGPSKESYIFIDMYNKAPLQVPAGFTQRK